MTGGNTRVVRKHYDLRKVIITIQLGMSDSLSC